MARPSLTRAHRALLGVVAAGACLISGIGFAGSYSAVRELAVQKGFGAFSYAFPIGVDAGIVVLLALDLVLTWLRIPFPLLRQAAWLLTVATISFNAAASWGDPLGMGMHAVIPVLFVVVVEASRHAVGRIAAITADRHMESVRLMRWLLSPVPTFRLWRRMKLWELRSYDEVVRLEQNRLVYRAQLRFRYGRGWRRSAPIQALLPLKLAKYGVPLDLTTLDRIDGPLSSQAAAQGAGSTVPAVSAAVAVPTLAKLAATRWRDAQGGQETPESQAAQDLQAAQGAPATTGAGVPQAGRAPGMNAGQPAPLVRSSPLPSAQQGVGAGRQAPTAQSVAAGAGPGPDDPRVGSGVQVADGTNVSRVAGQMSPWFKPPRAPRPQSGHPSVGQPQAAHPQPGHGQAREPQTAARQARRVAPDSVFASRASIPGSEPDEPRPFVRQAADRRDRRPADPREAGGGRRGIVEAALRAEYGPGGADGMDPGADVALESGADAGDDLQAPESQGPELTVDLCVEALVSYQDAHGHDPDEERLARYLFTQYGVTGQHPDGPVSVGEMRRLWPELQDRYAIMGRE